MEQNKDEYNDKNKSITAFEVAYLSSGDTQFSKSEGYRRILDRVYEKQRKLK